MSTVSDLDTWRLFFKIVSRGSIAKVSEEIGVEASSISRRINKLEKDLGVELFQRKGDHVPFPVFAVDVHDVKLEQQIQLPSVPDDTVRIIQSDAGRFAYAHTIPAVKAAFAHLAQMGMQRRLEGRMLARESVA